MSLTNDTTVQDTEQIKLLTDSANYELTCVICQQPGGFNRAAKSKEIFAEMMHKMGWRHMTLSEPINLAGPVCPSCAKLRVSSVGGLTRLPLPKGTTNEANA